MSAEVMPASVVARLCKLLYTKPMLTRNCSVTRQSSRTELHFRNRVPYSFGWIASPATRDCLSRHWISWRLMPLKAMRVLHAHRMCHAALQAIFQSVTIAKLLYATSVWIGFTKATDRQRVDGFLRHSIRSGCCSPDTPTFA